jgi:hypothetical protein
MSFATAFDYYKRTTDILESPMEEHKGHFKKLFDDLTVGKFDFSKESDSLFKIKILEREFYVRLSFNLVNVENDRHPKFKMQPKYSVFEKIISLNNDGSYTEKEFLGYGIFNKDFYTGTHKDGFQFQPQYFSMFLLYDILKYFGLVVKEPSEFMDT